MTFSPGVLSGAADRLTQGADPSWLDPSAWGRAHMSGWEPAWYQDFILSELAHKRKVSVVGPHGIGKTSTDAIAVFWFALTREMAGKDWKVVTTAGAWRQLQRYLWPEIHKWARRLKTGVGRNALQTTMLKLMYGQAFAVASDLPANIEGAHADEILYIIDEAKNVIPETWDAIEGAMSAGNAYCLANSTPGKAEGRLYEIHSGRKGYEDWTTIHVTLEDAIKAGRIRQEWADARAKQWGVTSPIYLNRVLGEFSTTDSDGVIPLDWLEEANERWAELNDLGAITSTPLTALAADVASEEGIDKSILATLHGDVIGRLYSYPHVDTVKLSSEIEMLVRSLGANSTKRREQPYAVIDAIGIGTGVVDMLRKKKIHVDAFMGSNKPLHQDKTGELTFLNRRAEAWWGLKDLLNPTWESNIAIPGGIVGGYDYGGLTGDLVAPKYDQTPSGHIRIEDKDDIIKRLGRSPDEGDAVVMAYNARLNRGYDLVGSQPISFTKKSRWLREAVR